MSKQQRAADVRSALQMWSDYYTMPGYMFDQTYPWLAWSHTNTVRGRRDDLMFAFTEAALK